MKIKKIDLIFFTLFLIVISSCTQFLRDVGIDNEPPIISQLLPSTIGEGFLINYTVSEPSTLYVYFSTNDNELNSEEIISQAIITLTTFNTTGTLTIPSLSLSADGIYNIHITLVDFRGNISDKPRIIKDVTQPDLFISALSPQGAFHTSSGGSLNELSITFTSRSGNSIFRNDTGTVTVVDLTALETLARSITNEEIILTNIFQEALLESNLEDITPVTDFHPYITNIYSNTLIMTNFFISDVGRINGHTLILNFNGRFSLFPIEIMLFYWKILFVTKVITFFKELV